MTDREMARRRLAGMLGSAVFARLGVDRVWMAEILAELRFLEDIGFMMWAFPTDDGWRVTYQGREQPTMPRLRTARW